MALNISIPQRSFEHGMNEQPATYGSDTIPAGSATVTIDCGDLTTDSMVDILQNEPSFGCHGRPFEAKYNSGGTYQRTNGTNGTFVVSTVDGANASQDITFDWIVLPKGAL
jgi:hypothetical protein